MNVKKFKKPSLVLVNELLEKARVATVPGSAFGNTGEGYLRLSFATSQERLREGLRRFAEFERAE